MAVPRQQVHVADLDAHLRLCRIDIPSVNGAADQALLDVQVDTERLAREQMQKGLAEGFVLVAILECYVVVANDLLIGRRQLNHR